MTRSAAHGSYRAALRTKSVRDSRADPTVEDGGHALRRDLTVLDLIVFGVVIGTGIFVLTGEQAHDNAGPAIVLSFVLAGVACLFAALWVTTVLTGVVVAVLAAFISLRKLAELVNVGTLFAFVVVSIGVIVLRRTRPDLDRPFRVPWVPWLPLLSVLACLWLMVNLPVDTWIRFGVWLVAGLAIYFGYGMRHSRLASLAAAEREAVGSSP